MVGGAESRVADLFFRSAAFHSTNCGRTNQVHATAPILQRSNESMKSDNKCALVGIDVGTSGVRGVAVSPAGELLAEAEEKIRQDHRAAGGIHEQDPGEWWEALCSVGQDIVKSLKDKSGDVELRGVAVTSTSGSLVVADAEGRVLRPAILYDDGEWRLRRN